MSHIHTGVKGLFSFVGKYVLCFTCRNLNIMNENRYLATDEKNLLSCCVWMC